MAYITKNINILLLVLIVLIASSLVGATVYYQNTFQDLNDEYTSKSELLQNISAELAKQQQMLNQTTGELAIKTTREAELSKKYSNLTDIKEYLEAYSADLEQEVDTLKDDYVAKSNELKNVKLQNTNLTVQVDDLEDQVEDMDDIIDDLEDQVDCLKDTADADEGDC